MESSYIYMEKSTDYSNQPCDSSNINVIIMFTVLTTDTVLTLYRDLPARALISWYVSDLTVQDKQTSQDRPGPHLYSLSLAV